MPKIQSITPCLWFDHQGEDAAKFYVSVFGEGSKITGISRYTDAGHEIHGRPAGSVMTVAFELQGHPFTALNGGPIFKFNEAISLQVMCDTQEQIDYFWQKLGEVGDPRAQQCGWLKDKFGLSWQIAPTLIPKLMTDPDPAKTSRVMNAVLKMKKIDIAAIERAYRG